MLFERRKILSRLLSTPLISFTEKKGLEQTLITDFVNQLTPRDKSGAEMIDVVESIQGDDQMP